MGILIFHYLDHIQKKNFGILDIVKYSNTMQREYYVAPHVDPGLFSISVVSTLLGLQMFNKKENVWVDIPVNSSILWCGLATEEMSKGIIKSGLHKVIIKENAPRLSLWYEVCTAEQCYVATHSNGLKGGMIVKVKTLSAKEILVDISPEDTIERLMERIEEKEGIPPPKQRLIFAGKALNPTVLVKNYNIQAGSTVHLVLAL